MNIAFFTEGGHDGFKISRNNPNMRTDMAWMCALKADHWNINQTPNQRYDLGIVIIPKNTPQFDINRIKSFCSKIAIMQEGPNWYWQDYPLNQQVWYYNTIQQADFMFVHNYADKKYYEGLTSKECKILPSLVIEDSIKNLPNTKRENVMIGGNFCSWYGGFDSYIIAQEAECPIYIPSMGRKIDGEENLPNLNHLPYMSWVDWIKSLNKFKYGIHLMRTHAAGTFALNCAYLGIPCIGYEGLDTQEKCHPDLTVKLGDLNSAKKLIIKLRDNQDFYVHCANICKQNYLHSSYNEVNFVKEMKTKLEYE